MIEIMRKINFIVNVTQYGRSLVMSSYQDTADTIPWSDLK